MVAIIALVFALAYLCAASYRSQSEGIRRDLTVPRADVARRRREVSKIN